MGGTGTASKRRSTRQKKRVSPGVGGRVIDLHLTADEVDYLLRFRDQINAEAGVPALTLQQIIRQCVMYTINDCNEKAMRMVAEQKEKERVEYSGDADSNRSETPLPSTDSDVLADPSHAQSDTGRSSEASAT